MLLILLQNVPPDLAICSFILEQSLSVRALQEMLANTVEMTEVTVKTRDKDIGNRWNNIWRREENTSAHPLKIKQIRIRPMNEKQTWLERLTEYLFAYYFLFSLHRLYFQSLSV